MTANDDISWPKPRDNEGTGLLNRRTYTPPARMGGSNREQSNC